MMKPMLVLAVLLVAVGITLAGSMAPAAPAAPAAGATKTHEVKAEIVSMDVAAKTLTIKDESGETKTVPVLGNAEQVLKHAKAGEHVLLTCQDTDAGEHQGVTKIKPVTAAAKK